MLKVGRFEITSVKTGYCRLDGGAMFGVVPKVLWQKTEDVDDFNRILLAMRTLVAADQEAGRVVLVDTGAGSKWSEKEAERYAVENDAPALPGHLEQRGFSIDDVTDVVITHAHFDHCGGLTEWENEPDGPTKVRFRNARHWVHEEHWRQANSPTERDRASFLARDFEVLEKEGVLEMVKGDDPPPPMEGVRWVLSHGHTPYLLLPFFEDAEHSLLFTGDMIPTSSHLPPPWVMAYDLYPLTTLEEKKKVMAMCRDEGLYLAFPHDWRMGGAEVAVEGKKVKVKQPLPLEL
ncbi:MAG: MBL fold metallo-hydrolase [Planctomycetota bacterium]|jgi:glyoxylase-like metal-dependent hydrolase (beta-lactamase superfamily II)